MTTVRIHAVRTIAIHSLIKHVSKGLGFLGFDAAVAVLLHYHSIVIFVMLLHSDLGFVVA